MSNQRVAIIEGWLVKTAVICAFATPSIAIANGDSRTAAVSANKSEVSRQLRTMPVPSLAVGGETIVPGSTSGTVDDLRSWSRKLLKRISSCANPCEVRVDNQTFYLNPTKLGEGVRGIVFLLTDGTAIKFSKPTLPENYAILLEEKPFRDFWMRTAASVGVVVPQLLQMQEAGIYEVMEQVVGEPVTESFLRMGLLRIDPLTNEVEVDRRSSRIHPDDLRRIEKALVGLSKLMSKNPEHAISLAPDNLMVSWKNGRLKDIYLVDVGFDPVADKRYFNISNIEFYLQLSADKVRGYLGKYDIAARYHELNGQKSAILAKVLGRVTSIPVVSNGAYRNEPIDWSVAEILDLELPQQARMRVTVGDKAFETPKTVRDLMSLQFEIYTRIKNHDGPSIVVNINGNEMNLRTPVLGEGEIGIVCEIIGRDQVIKFAKPKLGSLVSMIREQEGWNFWHDRAMESRGLYDVPERLNADPMGLYVVMNKNQGEPLTYSLIRSGLVEYDGTTFRARKNLIGSNENVRRIEAAVMSILQSMRKNRDFSMSISPNNLHVKYDRYGESVDQITLIDIGIDLEPGRSLRPEKLGSVDTFADYLDFALNRLQNYLNKGKTDQKKLVALSQAYLESVSTNRVLESAKRLEKEISQVKGKSEVTVTIEGSEFRLRLPPIGVGNRGTVFEIIGTNKVIKILNSEKLSASMSPELRRGYDFWFSAAKNSKGVFSVPKRDPFDAAKPIVVMERNRGEPLTETLLRYSLLEWDGKNVRRHGERLKDYPQLDVIEVAILRMLELMRAKPEFALSISPNNIHVTWDETKTKIIDVSLVDTDLDGQPGKSIEKFKYVHTMGDYLDAAADALAKYLANGHVQSDKVRALSDEGARRALGQQSVSRPKQILHCGELF